MLAIVPMTYAIGPTTYGRMVFFNADRGVPNPAASPSGRYVDTLSTHVALSSENEGSAVLVHACARYLLK